MSRVTDDLGALSYLRARSQLTQLPPDKEKFKMAMEEARRDLQHRLEEVLGKEHALTLMAALPPTEAATKTDLRAEIGGLRADLRQEMRDMEVRLNERIDLKIESSENRVVASIRKELVTQTRVFVFSTLSAVVTVGGLAVAAARFG